jgi:Kef-type K+ transport system membrane component KefB
VLIETNLSGTDVGKLLMASCFVTDMSTVIALTVLFIKPTVYTAVFIAVSVVVIVLAAKFSHIVFDHPELKNKVIEPEIKYLLVLLLIFMYFASLGDGQAVLPAFLLGLFMSKQFVGSSETKRVRNRLRTVAYAVITPVFFIVGGTNVSVPLILTALGLFVAFLAIKFSAKFVGVYFLAKKYIPHGSLHHPPNEHRADLRHDRERLRLDCGIHQSGTVFGAGGRRGSNGSDPHFHRSKVVHARPL